MSKVSHGEGAHLSVRRAAVLSVAVTALLAASLAGAGAAFGSISPPVVAAVNVFPVGIGASAPAGDVSVTEGAVAQLQSGDVLTYRFEDSGGASTLHFATAGTVSGTNGLAATVALASSNVSGAPLDDEMKVTLTGTSTGSAFPGVLVLSGLTVSSDSGAAAGNDRVVVSDSVGTITTPVTVADANLLSLTTLHAPYAAQSTPTILPTANNQLVGNVAITEPVKSFFATNDVITLSLRDADGSANTVGLAAAPYAAGGSMTVGVVGANGPTVQVNDTAFKVDIVQADPSQGSASTITISNLVVNTAEAPLGPVTLSAVVTTGSGTEYILPGRVAIANVGGNTTTTAAGAPLVALDTADQPAGNVTISATAGSLVHDDTISLQIQTTGVTFTSSALPIATVTTGSLVLDNATPTLDQAGDTATWTVATGNVTASTVVIGPVYFDVGPSATPGQPVTLLAAGEAGSAFTSQVVTNATLAQSPAVTSFSTVPASVPSVNVAPWAGAPVVYTEAALGATPVGSSIDLISPYATQISAYRTTFASLPAAATTGGLTLGPPTVNSSALVIATAQGTITAPPQTVVSFPVTVASTSPATVTFTGVAFTVGNLVPPGTLLVTGTVEASGGTTTSLAGNQVVDLVDTHNLGTSSATTPPHVSITEQPPAVTSLTYATFAFVADEAGSTFACALDGIVVSLACPSPLTLPGLSNGSHTFTVQAFNPSGFGSTPVSVTWVVDNTPPAAVVRPPATLAAGITVAFSMPVEFVSSATVVLDQLPAAAPAQPLGATLTCVTQAGASGPCGATTFYTKVVVQPNALLLPGQHYALVLDPVGVSPAIADQAGNALPLTTAGFRGALVQDDTTPAATIGWATGSASAASGGSYAVGHLAGAHAQFTFSGTGVTWYTATGPAQGEARVYVDNVLKATVNNYASATHFGVPRPFTGLSNARHTLTIVVLGVKGAASGTDTQIVVDDFVVGATVTQQNGPNVTYTWQRVAAAGASGGAYSVDDMTGANFRFTFRGIAVKWFTVRGPTMGSARIYVDGVLKATVNNYASAYQYSYAYTLSGLTDAVHVLTVIVLGTHTSPSTGNRVVVDGFAVT